MPSYLSTTDPELPIDYLIELGRIVVAYNKLDSLLVHTLILALLGDFSKDGRALAACIHMSFPQKMHALSATLKICDLSLAEIYSNKVEHLLNESAQKRNAALHQPRMLEEDGVKRLDIKARGTLTFAVNKISIFELLNVTQFIEEAYVELLLKVSIPLGISFSPEQQQNANDSSTNSASP